MTIPLSKSLKTVPWKNTLYNIECHAKNHFSLFPEKTTLMTRVFKIETINVISKINGFQEKIYKPVFIAEFDCENDARNFIMGITRQSADFKSHTLNFSEEKTNNFLQEYCFSFKPQYIPHIKFVMEKHLEIFKSKM